MRVIDTNDDGAVSWRGSKLLDHRADQLETASAGRCGPR